MTKNSPKNLIQDKSTNCELNNIISTQKSEIKALVYGITSKKIPLKTRTLIASEHFKKFFWITSIDSEIQENQIGKILERVVIEYFMNYSKCILSEFTQESLWIDFLLNYFDLKIWVDISLNSKVAESKVTKLIKTAQKIDQDHNIWTQALAKRPDLCASMIFQLPPYLQATIIDWFNERRENNYQHHWTSYTQNFDQIDNYLKSLIKIINTIFFENIVKANLIDTYYEHEWFKAEINYDINKEVYHINIFNNMWYKSVSLSIILTWKYFKKVSPWVKFQRIYDGWINDVKEFYKNRESQTFRSRGKNSHIQASNWMFIDWDIDINTINNIPQDIINKIK